MFLDVVQKKAFLGATLRPGVGVRRRGDWRPRQRDGALGGWQGWRPEAAGTGQHCHLALLSWALESKLVF